MGIRKDLIGQKFGRLTPNKMIGLHKGRSCIWLCQCDCGNEKIVSSNSLVQGNVKSCGCLFKEGNNKKHGHAIKNKESKIYASWKSMIQRCTNKNNKRYKDYGGRGITICERWLKFNNFLEDMGEKPKGLTLDRINNNRGYCKGNCKWSSYMSQMRNTRRNNLIIIDGQTMCVEDACKKYNIKSKTAHTRIKRGWTTEEVFRTPARKRRIAK